MAPATLRFRHFAHLPEARVHFGDLTLLVGPQASGKSLVAQLWKWVLDTDFVHALLQEYGYQVETWRDFAEAYFGEGLGRAAWRATTRVWHQDNPWPKREAEILKAWHTSPGDEQVFYIPAQRVLCLVNEWPRPFRDFGAGDPFVLKRFSEVMRRALDEAHLEADEFPRAQTAWYEAVRRALYPQARIRIQTKDYRKRIVQRITTASQKGVDLPLMTWSAGQREFLPLLWAAHWLLPAQERRDKYRWIIVEEPEMGLHPQALRAFFVLLGEWLTRGYRVIITTHAVQVLEFGWVLQHFQAARARHPAHRATVQQALQSYLLATHLDATSLLERSVRVYFFKRQDGQVTIKDISGLDPWSDDMDEADWGGLTALTQRAQEAVARVANLLDLVE